MSEKAITHELLVGARRLLEDHWTDGEPDPPNTHCIISAVAEAGFGLPGSGLGEPFTTLTRQLLRDGNSGSLIEFNERHSKAEVLALFDEAIEAL